MHSTNSQQYLDKDLELILLGLEQLDEQLQDSVVEEGVTGDHLVQHSQVEGGVLCAELEVAGLGHRALHPPHHPHRNHWVPASQDDSV